VYDIIGKRRWFFLFSALITIPGLFFIIAGIATGGDVGLQFSIDFTGGTRWVVKFEDPAVTPDDVQQIFVEAGYPATTVFPTSNGFLEIRTDPLGLAAAPSPSPSPSPSASPSTSASPATSPSASPAASASTSASPAASPSASAAPSASPSASAAPSASPSPSPSASASPSASPSPSPSASPSASPSPSPSPSPGSTIGGGDNSQIPTSGVLGDLATSMKDQLGPFDQAILTTIGPVVSSDLIQQALVLILVGSLGILAWVTFRFHDVKFGVTALIALLHDVLVVVGVFAILGTFFRVEIDSLFVTAMLTVIGFSVHDTIVVFDRVRENKSRHAGEPFPDIVNHSILQTLGRSILTSFTVFLTLLALLLFGGPSIRYFVLALLIGIVSGTYSSIFNASPLLVVWQGWEDRRKGRLSTARPQRRTAT
jgi:preprotein translocase SecF subunit